MHTDMPRGRIIIIISFLLPIAAESFSVAGTYRDHAGCQGTGRGGDDAVGGTRMTASASTSTSSPTLITNADIGASEIEGSVEIPAPAEEKEKVTSSSSKRRRGAISMQIPELARALGGWGRARLAWDCYAIGVDPAHFFSSSSSSLSETAEAAAEAATTPPTPDDDEYGGEDRATKIYNLLPTSRKGQNLGKDALEKLARLYPDAEGGCLEGGVAKISHVSQSRDLTTKVLLKLSDGLEVESVIIPWKGSRSTLCISSQVGCRQGCTFCATGRMGRLRSLSSDEILAQMFYARKFCRRYDLPPITNVVFMGMGEPADNADAVTTATEILTTDELFQLSATRVTVSTVAPTPDSFKRFAKAPCVLAWSVHAANDDLRRRLVPTTRYSMEELRGGLIEALLERSPNLRGAMLEVALMAGVNDSVGEADELADFARVVVDSVPGCSLVVNIIPFNDIGQTLYKRPSDDAVAAFQRRLWSRGIYAHVRNARGDDESAACGQLATRKKKER